MINKINNIEELRLEQLRLRKRKEELEFTLSADVALIKEDLKPGNLIKKSLNSITGFNDFKGNDVINTALTTGLNFLVTKVFLRKSGVLKQLIATFILRKYGVDFVDKNSDDIIGFVKNLITKFRSRKRSKEQFDIYDGGTVAEEY